MIDKILGMLVVLVILTGLSIVLYGEVTVKEYTLISKYGAVAHNLKSLEDCNRVKEILKIEGVCVEQ